MFLYLEVRRDCGWLLTNVSVRFMVSVPNLWRPSGHPREYNCYVASCASQWLAYRGLIMNNVKQMFFYLNDTNRVLKFCWFYVDFCVAYLSACRLPITTATWTRVWSIYSSVDVHSAHTAVKRWHEDWCGDHAEFGRVSAWLFCTHRTT